MCILCGEMISTLHWSELNFKEEKHELSVGEEQKERLRIRLKKVKILNEILEFYGLKLKEWQNSKYILSNKKGVILSLMIWAICGLRLASLKKNHLMY